MDRQQSPDTYVFGYWLDLADGSYRFVPVFEGEFSDLEALKANWGRPEYHGKRKIKDCRWEIRRADEVWVA